MKTEVNAVVDAEAGKVELLAASAAGEAALTKFDLLLQEPGARLELFCTDLGGTGRYRLWLAFRRTSTPVAPAAAPPPDELQRLKDDLAEKDKQLNRLASFRARVCSVLHLVNHTSDATVVEHIRQLGEAPRAAAAPTPATEPNENTIGDPLVVSYLRDRLGIQNPRRHDISVVVEEALRARAARRELRHILGADITEPDAALLGRVRQLKNGQGHLPPPRSTPDSVMSDILYRYGPPLPVSASHTTLPLPTHEVLTPWSAAAKQAQKALEVCGSVLGLVERLLDKLLDSPRKA